MRPKNADSEDTWFRIVAAAREELVDDEQGGIDVSVRSVATNAGVSLGTIHYYFPTKGSLLEACLDAYYEALGKVAAEVATRIQSATRETAKEAIGEGVRSIYRFELSERARLRLRATNNAHRGRLHPDRHLHVRGPYLDTFTALLAPLVDADAEEIRLTFQTLTFSVMQYVLLSDEEIVQIAGKSGDEGRRVLEDHVVRVGTRMLFRS
jgi:AcrR family transcriptional regulator